MFCTNCGKEVPEGKAFCQACGARMPGVPAQAAGTVAQGVAQVTTGWKDIFVSPDETYLGEMGDGYLKGTLSGPFGVAKKCNAVVSDKRVYLQGKMLDVSLGRINAFTWVKTVNVKDITGTGFVAINSLSTLLASIFYGILSVFFLIMSTECYGREKWGLSVFGKLMLVFAIVFLIIYLVKRSVFFVIEYAGGRIQFNATLVGYEKVRAFQHLIIRAKDAAK